MCQGCHTKKNTSNWFEFAGVVNRQCVVCQNGENSSWFSNRANHNQAHTHNNSDRELQYIRLDVKRSQNIEKSIAWSQRRDAFCLNILILFRVCFVVCDFVDFFSCSFIKLPFFSKLNIRMRNWWFRAWTMLKIFWEEKSIKAKQRYVKWPIFF